MHDLLNLDRGNIELENKIMFDMRFYFYHRGNENVHSWTKETFKLKFDIENSMSFVEKILDEETKNHKETNAEVQTGVIPQLLIC